MKIIIANDHGGLHLKNLLVDYLKTSNSEILNLGLDKNASVDYPDFAYSMSLEFKKNYFDFGILICGSGIGMSIAANRYEHIRAALCHDVTSSKLARLHNNANIIVLGGRLIGSELAIECVNTFLSTKYEGGRHQNRINKLSNPPLI